MLELIHVGGGSGIWGDTIRTQFLLLDTHPDGVKVSGVPVHSPGSCVHNNNNINTRGPRESSCMLDTVEPCRNPLVIRIIKFLTICDLLMGKELVALDRSQVLNEHEHRD